MNIDVDFILDEHNIDADLMEHNASIADSMGQVVVVSERDHANLKNRDAEDQHPIKAITNLSQELNNRVNIDSVISALDIIKIMEG